MAGRAVVLRFSAVDDKNCWGKGTHGAKKSISQFITCTFILYPPDEVHCKNQLLRGLQETSVRDPSPACGSGHSPDARESSTKILWRLLFFVRLLSCDPPLANSTQESTRHA